MGNPEDRFSCAAVHSQFIGFSNTGSPETANATGNNQHRKLIIVWEQLSTQPGGNGKKKKKR